MERLWAGWRLPYISGNEGDSPVPAVPGLSLFEGIERSGLADAETYVLWRGEWCFALLNAYPYSTGHLMVLPKRAVPELEDLTAEEHIELFAAVRDGVVALKAAYSPHGVNVGINLGRGAGAGVPDHLHVHCVPRWTGDTNFMTSVAEARVLPESLGDTWMRLVGSWPR